MSQARTLVAATLPSQTLAAKALMVFAGSALIALGAQVAVPMWPVPMTLQTLAVMLVGLAAGSRLGAAAVLTYLVQGAAGLPVFAGGTAGLAVLVGPTAGFLWGFVGLAFAAGWLVERGFARGFWRTLGIAVALSVALYLPGVLWLTAITPLTLSGAAGAGMLPFLAGDAVKTVVAALVVTGGWAALSGR